MKAAAVLAVLLVVTVQHAGAAEPPDLQALRGAYEAAVTRTMKPLSETYLAELKKLRDQYTRAAKLDEANAVQAEITLITNKLAALTAAPGPAASSQPAVLDTIAAIPAAAPGGYKLPPLHRGDTITLSYVSGLWKCDGNIPTENPDAAVTDRGDRTRLVLAEGPKNGVPGDIIKMVPPGTKDTPFVYVVQTTRDDVVLRIHSGSDNPKAPGSVTYAVKITR